MPNFEKFSSLQIPEDSGAKKLYAFLEKSGFTEIISDSEQFQNWVKTLSFDEFRSHLTRLNGIVREIPIKERNVDGTDVSIGNEEMGVGFLPPHPDDKDILLKESFEKIQALDNSEDQGLLLYLVVQYLHLFNDGNGRLGRLLYYMAYKAKGSSEIDEAEMQGLLGHDGVSGPGRNIFSRVVRAPSQVTNIVNQLLARELLSEEFIKQQRRPFADDLMAGSIKIENDSLDTETKKQLEIVLSEAGGVFSFRDLVMLKFLENHGLLEEYESNLDYEDMDEKTKDVQKTLYRYNAHSLLSSISEDDAQEMLMISRDIKKRFVKTVTDTISEPEKYRINEEKTVRDLFSNKDQD